MKKYTVKRQKVQDALECLCFGVPNGGLDQQLTNYKMYGGPDHVQKKLKGRYFEYFPNEYYHNTLIDVEKLS